MSILQWREDLSNEEWDKNLTVAKGHPLQSAVWGDARQLIDGIQDHRWMAYRENKPICMVRFEERNFFKLFRLAWLPRGPICLDKEEIILPELKQRLKLKGFQFCITNPWKRVSFNKDCMQTIWVDLNKGENDIWNNCEPDFRNGVRRAEKNKVSVEMCADGNMVEAFYLLNKKLAEIKKFPLKTSSKLMNFLLQKSNTHISSHLFLAKYMDDMCGGAFVIRCGQNLHVMWTAMDRAFSSVRPQEMIIWSILKWGIQQNCQLFDFEGIDKRKNLSTYNFKKKVNGEVVTLAGEEIHALSSYLFFSKYILKNDKIKNYLRSRLVS